jgi:Flp pilus assembly pilin Flp
MLKARRTCRGQALVEYALILAFISILTIAVSSSMGQGIRGVYSNITYQLQISTGIH